MKELEEIQKNIGGAEKRHAEVKKELVDLRALLIAKRKEQGSAIVDEKDAQKLGKDIVSLQTQIDGAEEARAQLLETLRSLQASKAATLRAIAMDQAEMKKADILQIEQDIYDLLVQAAKRLPDLYENRAEYVRQLVAANGPLDAKDEGHKITVLHETLRREIPNLLDCFPRSVLVDGTLPAPATVRGAIRRS